MDYSQFQSYVQNTYRNIIRDTDTCMCQHKSIEPPLNTVMKAERHYCQIK